MAKTRWSDSTYASIKTDYSTKTAKEIFNDTLDSLMNPKNMKIRECLDSVVNPTSLAISVFLDVTGSMKKIPENLVKYKLGSLINVMLKHDIPDPTILFAAIGDHECDRYPLQVGQFESGTLELDKWLTSAVLEGGGGGNAGESYLLAWYVASRYSRLDCFEKRGKKGYLFTIGDEPTLRTVSGRYLQDIFGLSQTSDATAEQLLKEAQQLYHVFHIHCVEGSNGHDKNVIDGWKELLGQHLIMLDDSNSIAETIASTIAIMEGGDKDAVLSSLGSSSTSVSKALVNVSNQSGVVSSPIIEF